MTGLRSDGLNMGKARGLFRIIRPVNCLMMGFAVIIGASLAGIGSILSEAVPRLLLGFITAFTLTGSSMALNDYCDREIDKINEPNRPIPSGAVTPNESLLLASVLTTLGFAAAIYTNPYCLVIAVIAWAILLTYITKGKRTGLPGNFLVSMCIAIALIYGGFIVVQRLELTIILSAALAFLSNTGREVTKGIVDIQGDRTKNIRTIAVSYGAGIAAYIASISYLSVVCLSFLPILLNLVSMWFVPFVIVADVGFAVSSILLIHDHSRDNARRIKNLSLAWMMMGLIAFLAGGITVNPF